MYHCLGAKKVLFCGFDHTIMIMQVHSIHFDKAKKGAKHQCAIPNDQ